MRERISVSLGKCKLKPQWIITTLSIKIFKIEKKIKKKNIDKNVEQLDLYTTFDVGVGNTDFTCL